MSLPIRQLPQEASDDVVARSHPLEGPEGGPAIQYNLLQAVILQKKPQNLASSMKKIEQEILTRKEKKAWACFLCRYSHVK